MKAREVALADRAAVDALERVLPVGRRRERADAPEHELAGASRLQVLRPLRRLEHGAQAERVHVLFPELVELARRLIGLRRHLEQQRAAVGLLAPAVAVAIDIAVD